MTVLDPPATPGEIQPRLAFLASPFAVIAETARFAEFGPAGGTFSADSIGVNESNPQTSLHIDGKTYIEGGVGAPGNGQFGGAGARLVLWPGGAASTPYALGIDNSTLWYGGPTAASHRWYAGTTETMSLNPTGNLRVSGHLTLGAGGYIDDDTTLGGEADDWLRLNGYIEMKSITDNYGIVLRDKDTSSYMGITQIDGYSYLADSTTAANYFLRGDGPNAHVPGTLSGGHISTGGNLTGYEVYANNWFRNNNSGTGLYNTATTMHWYSEADGQFSLYDNTATNVKIRFKTAGGVTNGYAYADTGNGGQIGFLSKNHAWTLVTRHTNGTNYASYDGDSNWDFYSDRRLKKNINKELNLLERIVKLDVVNYDFKDDSNKEKEIGFIAQDVEPYFPSLVSESEDPRYDFKVKALGYSSFGVLAIGGLQELKLEKDEDIKALEAENAKLRSQLAAQEKRLAELETKDRDREARLSAIEERFLFPDKAITPIIAK